MTVDEEIAERIAQQETEKEPKVKSHNDEHKRITNDDLA
jgi:hypothetical protein